MPARATVTVDLGKVRENARTVVDHLPGISVVAVTKVTCGSPQVGRAMLAGGARALGESRLENAQRLRDAGLTAPIWLLRAPPPELAGETVQLTDVSLESELETVVALENAAAAAGRRHAIVAMVDLGDLREGMLPDGAAGLPRARQRHGPHRHRRHRRQPHLLRGDRPRRGRTSASWPSSRGRASSSSAARSSSRAATRAPSAWSPPAACPRPSTRCASARPSCSASTRSRASPRSACTATRSPSRRRSSSAWSSRRCRGARAPRTRSATSRPSATAGSGGARSAPWGARTRRPRASRRSTRASRCSAPPATTSSSTSTRSTARRRSASPSAFVPTYAATLQLFTSPYVHKVFTPPA